VVEAAGALGYAANAMARGLVRQRTHHLGVVVSSRQKMLATFFAEILAGIEETAAGRGYFPLLCPLTDDERPGRPASESERLDEMLRSRRVDGLLFNKEEVPNALVQRLAAAGWPLVLINGVVPETSLPIHAVTVDNRRGVHLAVAHLVRQGHRRIAYLTRRFQSVEWTYRSYVEAEKVAGYQEALQGFGLPWDAELVREGSDIEKTPNQVAVEALLARVPRPTAIVAADDAMAIAVLGILQRRGLRVPADISVMGYGNLRVSSMVEPALSTVESPLRQMGARGMEMLINLLEKKPADPAHVMLAPHLVARDSCAAAGSIEPAPRSFAPWDG